MNTENNSVPNVLFAESVAYLLRETFVGSPDGQPNVYLDRGVGFFATLDQISALGASTEFYGTTIAAQTEHAKFYLDRLCEFLGGRTETVNWEQSWLIETVDDREWALLRETVKHTYEGALRCIAETTEWGGRGVGIAIGMVVHTAYHLGAIRQIAKAVAK